MLTVIYTMEVVHKRPNHKTYLDLRFSKTLVLVKSRVSKFRLIFTINNSNPRFNLSNLP